MADISKIQLPDGSQPLDIKDANAVTDITINGASTGVSKTGRTVDLTISGADSAGKKVAGTVFTKSDGTTVTAGTGAEQFNVYTTNRQTDTNTNIATGQYSHAEGSNTSAYGDYSHAEGSNTDSKGFCAHAEGISTVAYGDYSHAEGNTSVASGDYSHAEGSNTIASGDHSHAEGSTSVASGDYSHAEGHGTTAGSDNQHVEGKYNIEDAQGTYAHIIGNGTNSNTRSNAYCIDWNGKIYQPSDPNANVNGVYLSDKQDKLTFDDTPTQNSDNPVKSNGIYTALAAKATPADITSAINALDAASVGGTGKYISAISETNGVISATDITMDTAPISGSSKAITSGGVYTAQAAQNAAISAAVNAGQKNQFNIAASAPEKAKTSDTLTVTDGEVSYSTGSGYGYFRVAVSLPAGTYIASGNIVSINGTSPIIGVSKNTNGSSQFANKSISGTGIAQMVFTADGDPFYLFFYSSNSSSAGETSITVSDIMIRDSAIPDSTFQPYAPSNRELYEMILALQL